MTAPRTTAPLGRTRRRRLRTSLVALLLVSPALQPLAAQSAPEGTAVTPTSAWRTARTGKWALLGTALLFGAYAVQRSNSANRAYDELRGACEADAQRCRLEDGRYVDPRTEALFDRAESEDARAQVGIVGGQVALLGSVGLFVYDLRNARTPRDIPYPGRATAAGSTPPPAGLAAGLRFTF